MQLGQVLDWLNEQLNNLTKDLVQKPSQRLSPTFHEGDHESPPKTGDGTHQPRNSERVNIWTAVLLSQQRGESWLVIVDHVNPIPLCKRWVRDGQVTLFCPMRWRRKSAGDFWKRFYPLKWKTRKWESCFCSWPLPSFLPSQNASRHCEDMMLGVTAATLWSRGTMLLTMLRMAEQKEKKNLGPWHAGRAKLGITYLQTTNICNK